MPPAPQWRFGPFRLDTASGSLWHGDDLIPLRPKPYALLATLVAHAGEVVTKEALLDAGWPEMAVSEGVLKTSMAQVRQALGERAAAPTYVATVHRRGYRFIAPVTPFEAPTVLEPATAFGPAPDDVLQVPPLPPAERRQLTVWFCDLVDSTRLAGQLDPEELHELLHAYHQTCTEVVERFDGYVAQYLGDGILVYFGYPIAHEDDAQRAVWSGLELLAALEALNTRLALPAEERLAVRLGLHTGLVVVSQVGAGERREPLAQGETPHLAARLQNLAGTNELLISGATRELLGEVFQVKPLGDQILKGVATPMQVYRVEGPQAVASRYEAMRFTGVTPLVGREAELALLWQRWEQAVEGEGQVVLLSGEAGLGKSRLTQALCERLAEVPHLRVLYQCSPYHTHSAFYPIIAQLEHTLQLEQMSWPGVKLDCLENLLAQAGLAVAEVTPLIASLLSIPIGDRYAPITLSPERQKERTIEALVAQLVGGSHRDPRLLIVEDAHWSDPSTLEVLDRLVDEFQEAPVLALITYRPEFESRWRNYAHVTTHMLNRLTRPQVTALIAEVAGNKGLPREVLNQIVAKTDGVPLFVEELTKTVLESGLLEDQGDHYTLSGPLSPLRIPATLQDSLRARLDRLQSAKAVAQYASVIGRQTSYELLKAVLQLDETTLQQELRHLVEAELLYQRGTPPQATYTFKHALIQDSAYQSLLRRTKQAYHQRIAEVLTAQFPETVETQPALLAFHYTEAGLIEQSIGYWHRAGVLETERSAYLEAIAHLQNGLDLLHMLPETPERRQHQLTVLTTLGPAFMATKGYTSPEAENTYRRAHALCQQIEDSPQLFAVQRGLWSYYSVRGESQTALALAQQCLDVAQRGDEAILVVEAHMMLGSTLMRCGELMSALTHLHQGIRLYDALPQRFPRFVQDAGVGCRCYAARALWYLGHPDQARTHSHEALALAQHLDHPFSIMFSQYYMAYISRLLRESHTVKEQAEAAVISAKEQGFWFVEAGGAMLRGWSLMQHDDTAEGIAQIRQGLAQWRSDRIGGNLLLWFDLVAETYGIVGQVQEGLHVVDDALTLVDKHGIYDAELYRLKGTLLLQQPSGNAEEAESCYHQAIQIAQEQSAKSWELRAATSLARLWQSQGKRDEARQLLGDVYDWFTEGFDTADLRAAKALLDELPPVGT